MNWLVSLLNGGGCPVSGIVALHADPCYRQGGWITESATLGASVYDPGQRLPSIGKVYLYRRFALWTLEIVHPDIVYASLKSAAVAGGIVMLRPIGNPVVHVKRACGSLHVQIVNMGTARFQHVKIHISFAVPGKSL